MGPAGTPPITTAGLADRWTLRRLPAEATAELDAEGQTGGHANEVLDRDGAVFAAAARELSAASAAPADKGLFLGEAAAIRTGAHPEMWDADFVASSRALLRLGLVFTRTISTGHLSHDAAKRAAAAHREAFMEFHELNAEES